MIGWTPNDIVQWAIANCGLDDLDASRLLGDIEDVVKAEREACAILADAGKEMDFVQTAEHPTAWYACEVIGKAIRARGN